MPTVIKYKPARRSAVVFVGFLALLSLALNALIIFVLLQVRIAAKNTMTDTATRLDALSGQHFQYTVQINQTVPVATEITINKEISVPISMVVEQTIPIKTEIPFQDELTIPLSSADIGETFPISTTIPFNQVITVPVTVGLEQLLSTSALGAFGQEIIVPVDLGIDQLLPVSSTVSLNEAVSIPLELDINQEISATAQLFGQEITVPVNLDVNKIVSASANLITGGRGNVPLNLSINQVLPSDITVPLGVTTAETTDKGIIIPIPSVDEIIANVPEDQRTVQLEIPIVIDQEIPIQTEIPLDLPFGDGVSVAIDQTIPIDLEIPISLPIETEVIVPLDLTLPIAIEVPVVMDVPIDIALDDTPFGTYLREASDELRRMSRQF